MEMTLMENKQFLKTNSIGTIGHLGAKKISFLKNYLRAKSYTAYKNDLKVDQKLKCDMENY